MKDNEFDALLKKRLIDHETAVPADMWERISGKEKKPKSGFARWRYFFIALLLLVGTSSGYYLLNTAARKDDEMPLNRTETADLSIPHNTGERDSENVSTSNSNVMPQLSQLTEGDDSPGSRTINKPVIKKQRKSKTGTNSIVKPYYQDRENKPHPDITNVQTNFYATSPGPADTGIAQKKLTKEKIRAKTDSLSNTATTAGETNRDKFSIELYGSPDFPAVVYNANNIAWEEALKTAMSEKVSFTFGMRISYLITNKMSAKTGLQYSQINENINFRDSMGNNLSSANRYKTIGIPLLLSYEIAGNNNLHWSVNAGVILNIGTRYTGSIPSINGGMLDLKANEIYEKNPSADLYLGLDISRQINYKSDFFVEPRMSFSLSNTAHSFYRLSRKIYTPGLAFGWRYRLFNEKKPQFYSNE